MAYDQTKEKVLNSKEVKVGEGVTAVAKKYSYNGGPEKLKLNFRIKTSGTSPREFITSKFPAFEDPKDFLKVAKIMKELVGGK